MPPAYFGPAPSLRSAKARRGKVGPSLALRLRVRWNAAQLDAALADGADPGASESLALRAQQLADPKHRARIVSSIGHALDLADRGRAGLLTVTGGPLRSDRIEESRGQLLELVHRLEATDSPPVKGLAMANLLLEDGTAALYVHERSDPLLPAVEAILAALER